LEEKDMSKLPISRIFDTAIIAKTKAFAELEPFINWIQETQDTFFRAINGKLTLGDNIDAQLFTVRLRGNSVDQSVSLGLRARPVALFIGKQNPITPRFSSYAWQIGQNGQTEISVTFLSPPVNGVDITIVAFFG
jgi:hypothetical protein